MRRTITTACLAALLTTACFTPKANITAAELTESERATAARQQQLTDALSERSPGHSAAEAAAAAEADLGTSDALPTPAEVAAVAAHVEPPAPVAPESPQGPRTVVLPAVSAEPDHTHAPPEDHDTPHEHGTPDEQGTPQHGTEDEHITPAPMTTVGAPLLDVQPILTPITRPHKVAADAPGAAHPADPTSLAPSLFLTNCASCHGADGSGTGPAVLDRPARNFRDGGFSFGNTTEALFRTISMGIPGSPMPAFGASLSEADRRTLAAYVQTLGPPIAPVADADTHMLVTDTALFAKGILPPLDEGATLVPRGLLVGTPDGFSYEYSTDDLTLLAVRFGPFVRRTDWTGRGGSPLEPLGQPVWTHIGWSGPGGNSGALFASGDTPLVARLTGTAADGPHFTLTYALVHPTRGEVAQVVESVTPVTHPLGAGFRRDFTVTARLAGIDLALRRHPAGMPLRRRNGPDKPGDAAWFLMRILNQRAELWGVRRPGAEVPDSNTRGVYLLDLEGHVSEPQLLQLFTLLVPDWSPVQESALHASLPEESR